MHRCGSAVLLTLALAFVVAFTGCLGKSSGNSGSGGVESVSLSPSTTLSIDVGATQVFSASGKNAQGGAVLGVNIQYVVGVPQGVTSAPPLSVANNGNACAGTWDINVAICSPGPSGIATVTAVINGVSSVPTIVYIHQHVDSIQISNAQTQQPQYSCFSVEQTWNYQATAYSNNVDITSSVGPLSWSFNNPGVATALPYVPPNNPNTLNQVQTTAKAPGFAQLFASVSGTTSTPFSYTTCLVSYIRLQIGGQAGAGNSTTVNTGSSVPVTATVVDTLGYQLKNPPLTWSTTNPEVAAFSSPTSSANSNNAAARSNPGGATLFASCSPPSCNIGVPHSAPIYSSDGLLPTSQSTGYGAISVDVTLASSAKEPTYAAWVATTGCQGDPGCSSALFSVTAGNTAVGQIVSLPRTPNSMMFNHVAGPRIYFGTNQGLMYVDVTSASPSATLISNSPTPCNVSLCGTVLTISNDGKQVVVSDPPTGPTPGQVYIYNSTSNTAPVDLIFSDPTEVATAASFSPDQSKLFILTTRGSGSGNMYVYSTVDALGVLPLPIPATQAVFSADGSFAYVAGTPTSSSITAYSTCSLPTPAPASVNLNTVATTTPPYALFTSPVMPLPNPPDGSGGITQNIIALEPPNVQYFQATFTQNELPQLIAGQASQLTCNPPTVSSFTAGQSYTLGQGNTPLYAQLVADGSELILVEQNVPAVLIYNVSNGTTSSIPLARQGYGSSYPLAVVGSEQPGIPATASPDGSQVFVTACDQYDQNVPPQTCIVASVHVVSTCGVISCTAPPNVGLGDIDQIPFVNPNNNGSTNMCSDGGNGTAPTCFPNLIAVRPQ